MAKPLFIGASTTLALVSLLGLPQLALAQAGTETLEQASRIAEALKQAAAQGNTKPTGYYSDWQVKGDRIPLWSRQCIGREMTPQQFEENQATAGAIVVCILNGMVRQELRSARNDESLAVRRIAAWWVTGDPGRFNANGVAPYTQQVLSLYQPGQTVIATQPVASNPVVQPIAQPTAQPTVQPIAQPIVQPTLQPKVQPSAQPTAQPSPSPTPVVVPDKAIPDKPAAKPSADPNTPIAIKPTGTNFYDRYMQAGYATSKEKNFKRAMVFFRRALDERPGDSFATKAIENMEKLMTK